MIKLICGAKGSGKTKKIIDTANQTVEAAKGCIVYINDSNKYMYELNREIKFVNANEYDVQTELGLTGFVRGLVAGNSDIEYIFIDGASRMIGQDVEDLEGFIKKIDAISEKLNITFILTISCAVEKLPIFLTKFERI